MNSDNTMLSTLAKNFGVGICSTTVGDKIFNL